MSDVMPLPLKPTKEGITIHHSAGKDGITRDWPALCAYHVKKRGYEPPCGYHGGVELVGSRYEFQFGREPHRYGAHSVGFNYTHFGLVIIGNYEETLPTLDQLDFIEAVVRRLQASGWAGREVVPHRNQGQTLCPGKHLITALHERKVWTQEPRW